MFYILFWFFSKWSNCSTFDDPGDIPLPARRERLRESQDSNKENSIFDSINEDNVNELVEKGYDRMKVLEALRVAKNNMRMAEEILETFVKQS